MEEEEDWFLKNAVRVDDKVQHAATRFPHNHLGSREEEDLVVLIGAAVSPLVSTAPSLCSGCRAQFPGMSCTFSCSWFHD